MDPLQLLADLEGLRDKIPDPLRADYEGLIATIRNIYEMSIKFITPPQPVKDGQINLASHHTTVDGLCTQLGNSLPSFQSVYVGKGSDAYHTTAMASLQNLQLIRDHLATASQQHNTMEFQFNLATEEKIALVSLLIGLGITLGVLFVSAGSTAPVTVPAAVLEAAGGTVAIGLLTDAEAAAAAAIMALLWAELPSALLSGLIAMGGTELTLHTTFPMPHINLPQSLPNIPSRQGSQVTYLPARAHQNDLPIPGTATGPNVYIPPKGISTKDLDRAWDKVQQGFKDNQGRVWKWDTKHKDHWDVQLKDGSHINVFPDGVERGQRENNNQSNGNQVKGQKGKK